MRIGFAGLETSHPLTDARHLRAAVPSAEIVFVGRPERCALFAAEHPHARRVASLGDLVSAAPDVVVVSQRPEDVAEDAALLATRGVPAFINKPAATTGSQVDDLAAATRGAEDLFLTGSVLSFAPRVTALASRLDTNLVRSARVTIRHDVGWWRSPDFAWQAAPDGAGGIVPVIGVHAFDVLARLFGSDLEAVSATTWTEQYAGLPGGDHAQLEIRFGAGAIAHVELIGVADEESYSFSFAGDDGHELHAVRLGGEAGNDSFGYAATAHAVVELARTKRAPRAFGPSLDVLTQVVRAREAAETTAGRRSPATS